MRQAAAEYIKEEAHLRGARPRVKAVLYPFELDYGLAPGSGDYVNTCYGGAPGKLALTAGSYTAASWTSPVMPAFSPDLDSVSASWENQAAQMDVQVYLRVGETATAVFEATYEALTPGIEAALAPYFQVRVEFHQEVDKESSGCLANLCLGGRLRLPESEIIDPGSVGVDLAWDFSELRAGSHVLVLDQRQGQWLNRAAAPYLQGLASVRKQVDLYHGWEVPGGDVTWQLVYRGALQRLGNLAHGWSQPHQARFESQDWVTSRLRQMIGVPTSAGDRQPFMRGSYRARAELTEVTLPGVSAPVLAGPDQPACRCWEPTGAPTLRNIFWKCKAAARWAALPAAGPGTAARAGKTADLRASGPITR